MGMDPEARLFWGIVYNRPEDVNEDFEDEIDADDVMERADILEEEFEQEAVPKPDVPGYRGPEWDAWRERVQEWGMTAVKMRYRGGSDQDKPYIHIVGSQIQVEWDETAVIDPAALIEQPGWRDTLRTYVERLGLPWKEPGWHLVAYYG